MCVGVGVGVGMKMRVGVGVGDSQYRTYFRSLFPMLKQVTSREKTSYTMPSQVMYPSFHPELRHDRIDVRVASSSLFERLYSVHACMSVCVYECMSVLGHECMRVCVYECMSV